MRSRLGLKCKAFLIVLSAMPVFWSSAQAQIIDRIVAIVDSEIITLVDLELASKPYVRQLEAAGYPEEQQKKMEKQIHEKVLNLLIDQSLTGQEAKKYGISVSDQEIETAIENVRRQQSISQEQFKQMLEKEGSTLEDYKETIRTKILQSKLINHAVKSKVVITDAEIKAYYEANQNRYAGVRKYHLRNILMTDLEGIKEVYQQLNQKKKFTVLAREYSIAPNASDGGDLGFFDVNSFDEKIKTQIQDLKKGEFSDVIPTAQGYQIFYVQDIVLEGNKTLQQARDEIYDKLYAPKVEEKFKSWLDSLKAQAHIEIKL